MQKDNVIPDIGMIIKVNTPEGNYYQIPWRDEFEFRCGHRRLSQEGIRVGFQQHQEFPKGEPMQIVGYGLHPRAAVIVYILEPVNHPGRFYFYALQQFMDKVTVVRE
ncbi:MAG: hypothetical protein ACC608_09460 [Anaerofustis sp.]